MKTRKIKLLISFGAMLLFFSSCSYSELPPKTDSVSSNYVLPKGERPTAQEQQILEDIREEYKNSLTN